MDFKSNRHAGRERDRLLRVAINGDGEALNRLFARYMRHLYHVALRIMGTPQEAEDALQDGLLSAARNLKTFEGRSQFSTWLTRIVINAALMQLRRKRSQVAVSIDQKPLDPDELPWTDRIADPRPNPEEMCAQNEQFQVLEQAWQSLPAAYSSALRLRYVHGMSTKEAAKALCLREETLRSQLHRGRQRIIKAVRETLASRGTFEHCSERHGSTPIARADP